MAVAGLLGFVLLLLSIVLFVATDRISAYDVIMTEPIPDKGKVLTQLSAYFFDLLDVPSHMESMSVEGIDVGIDPVWLAGRSMIVRRAEMLPIECVVRGYLYGSSWREYAAGGGPSTEHLPGGLVQGSKLDQPIFTPATKAQAGHEGSVCCTSLESRRSLAHSPNLAIEFIQRYGMLPSS